MPLGQPLKAVKGALRHAWPAGMAGICGAGETLCTVRCGYVARGRDPATSSRLGFVVVGGEKVGAVREGQASRSMIRRTSGPSKRGPLSSAWKLEGRPRLSVTPPCFQLQRIRAHCADEFDSCSPSKFVLSEQVSCSPWFHTPVPRNRARASAGRAHALAHGTGDAARGSRCAAALTARAQERRVSESCAEVSCARRMRRKAVSRTGSWEPVRWVEE